MAVPRKAGGTCGHRLGGSSGGRRRAARRRPRAGCGGAACARRAGDRACPSAAATRPSSLRRIDSEIIASALDPHSLTIGTNVRDDAGLIASIRRYRKVPISQVARSGCSAKPAMDWVLERKQRIQNALADRPLEVPQQPGRAHGVLQPITAIRTHSGVQVRDGQRRTLAARQSTALHPRLGVRGRGGGGGDRDGQPQSQRRSRHCRPGCGPHQGHLLRCQIHTAASVRGEDRLKPLWRLNGRWSSPRTACSPTVSSTRSRRGLLHRPPARHGQGPRDTSAPSPRVRRHPAAADRRNFQSNICRPPRDMTVTSSCGRQPWSPPIS